MSTVNEKEIVLKTNAAEQKEKKRGGRNTPGVPGDLNDYSVAFACVEKKEKTVMSKQGAALSEMIHVTANPKPSPVVVSSLDKILPFFCL